MNTNKQGPHCLPAYLLNLLGIYGQTIVEVGSSFFYFLKKEGAGLGTKKELGEAREQEKPP